MESMDTKLAWKFISLGSYGFASSGSSGINIGSYSVILLWNKKVQLKSPVGGLWSPLEEWLTIGANLKVLCSWLVLDYNLSNVEARWGVARGCSDIIRLQP